MERQKREWNKEQKTEMADKETALERKYQELQEALTAVDDILINISAFDSISSRKEMDEAMPKLLASMGRYSMADRAYVFAWASADRQVLRMTYEWCREGVAPTMGVMQNVRICDMPSWAPKLENGEAIVSTDWEAEKENTPEEYALFDGQNIHSLIVIPIFSNKRLNGYIGFDNPGQEKQALSIRLLTSVGGHIGGLKENLDMMEELEEKQVSLEKSLAELKNALERATLNSEIIGSISKIYWLIYRMDLIKGTYEEISAKDEMHRLTGKHGSTVEVFREVRATVVSEEHQEMMERFMDPDTLPDRLQDTDSIAAEYRASSGSWHLARFIVKKRDEHGRVTNVLYAVSQIDKQKQQELEYQRKILETAEDARRANLAKTDFLRRMSHDIRTPINGIQGMVAIAEHFPDDLEKQKECRSKVKEASGFLLELVNSVLDMNKLESGRVVLDNEPFDLVKLLEEVNQIAEMNGQLRGLTISMDHTKIEHVHLLGSTLHLKQILLNIAGNAVKYNKDGGSIAFSTEELSCKNKEAVFRFTCSDTGRGMSKEFLEHAFEPFAQEENSARTSYMGTGLGLAIVKQLVEMMGGTIEVESERGVGTTFRITLPFALNEEYETAQRLAAEVTDDILRGKQILLAEDNELNLEIAEFMLENAGVIVTSAQNGEEAVSIFEQSEEHFFDLILMDVMMPVMDGLAATKQIRAMERSDAKQIPIFAMTANAFAEDIERSKEAGMNEHLCKPLNEEKLLQAIRQYLTKKTE